MPRVSTFAGRGFALAWWSYPSVHAGPIVDLGYSIYEGTDLGNGQNQFIGVRFAAPPLGELRWKKPQPPLTTTGVQQATTFQSVCFGVGQGLAAGLSEDCLFLNIWSPADSKPGDKFPVFFWIQGGGYETNANPNTNGSVLVTAADNKMVFVGLNYRVGAFGFLNSEIERSKGLDVNVGLFDQRQALEWLQEHISAASILFGGDPEQVVIVGASAGAGSVALHLIAFGGAPTNLFHGAFGVSPFFPSQFRVSELEWQFNLFASRAGCGTSPDPLECLRSQNSTTLQLANAGMAFPGRTNDALFPFIPAIDGDILVDFPYRLFEENRFVKVPTVFGDDTDEGTEFVANASSAAEMASFFMDQYPQLSEADTNAINALYPSFNVLTAAEIAAGIGVSHTSDLSFVFAPPETSPLTPILQAYYTSFVRTLNPNTLPVKGSIVWPQFNPSKNERILLQSNLTVETVPQSQRDRCIFWKGLGIKMEQ
ncbi:hypothetical protein Clacol_008120 [Clathrus columnatus]|uniref:Carboxylic ester hydrolase n=1 Tax=Clathrus columnatus TaxID=1419009 RepID=A0AAV5AK50_9AGAM|nr:hypothetical protein Clacol_008120 [Clathrus columnatus]